MPQQMIWFFVSIAFGLIAWGIVAARYIWPKLRVLPRNEALQPLLVLHSFRFVGLAALVPGVVSPDLPLSFAHSMAYGDIIAAALALISLLLLPSAAGVVVAWIFNLWRRGRSPQRLLPGQSRRFTGRPVGSRILSSNLDRAPSADYARAGLPNSSRTST